MTIVLDFNTMLGNTCKERFESIYIAISDIAKVIGPVSDIITSPEVASIFETSISGSWMHYNPESDICCHISIGSDRVPIRKDARINDNLIILIGFKRDEYIEIANFLGR